MVIMMNHLVYWVWLSLRCGAGSELGTYLLKHFSSPQEVYEADAAKLFSVEGLTEEIVSALIDKDLVYPQKIVEYCERVNVGILTPESANYPDRLRAIYAKPIVLYYRGRLPNIDDNVLIACVGTRTCSERGRQNAYALGRDLAYAGAIVVSGLASGIDAAAQKGVLDAGGHTIAVLGCGIDRIYPPQNGPLMRKIAETGTVLTEYAPGTEPFARNFPVRNRIISGLSQGTVVVEANSKSGSLITANHAQKQGRDIFAFPGTVEAPHAKGTNALIKRGAKLVTCAEDVLEDYELLYPDRIFTENIALNHYRKGSGQADIPAQEMSHPPIVQKKKIQRPAEKKSAKKTAPAKESAPAVQVQEKDIASCADSGCREILSVMQGTVSAEEIAAALSQKNGVPNDIGSVLGGLTVLEIDGFVEALPGGLYRRR